MLRRERQPALVKVVYHRLEFLAHKVSPEASPGFTLLLIGQLYRISIEEEYKWKNNEKLIQKILNLV